MKRNLLLTLLLLLGYSLGVYAQTSLEGKVTEEGSGEAVIFGTIALYKGGNLISGTESDLDGNYIFSNIDPGTYDVEVSFIGLATRRENGVVVKNGKSTKLDFALKEEGVVLDGIEIVDYKVPLIDFDNTTSQKTVTAEAIRNIPTRNVNRIAATTAGLTSTDGGDISIRGSRSNATDYYVDGIRVSSNAVLPASEIEQLQVVTGGLEAKYGDVTGGIISIISKGPSNTFNGGLELESSEYLDAFGYSLANFNMSGPILKNKQGNSILGFRVSGQYTNTRDASANANGVHRLSSEKIRELEENPTFELQGSQQPTGELLSMQDVQTLATRPNEGNQNIVLNGRLDAQLSKAIDISLSGTYIDGSNQFAPTPNNTSPHRWAFANWERNPFSYTDRIRGNFRFRHRLGKQTLDQSTEKSKRTSIRNASYIIQLGYENTKNTRDDLIHGQDLFNYGFYGNQAFDSPAFIGVVRDTNVWNTGTMQELFSNVFFDHIDFNDENAIGEYVRNEEINPALSKYQFENGNLLGASNNFWNYYNNVGRVYNTALKINNDTYTINMNAQFDLLPSGSIENRHNIQFGFQYEQRTNRFYSINPRELWQLASQQANAHFTGVDTTSLSGDSTFLTINGIVYTFETYNRRIEDRPENLFYRSVREKFGLSLTDYVNVNGLNPSDLSLDMFSASELINFRGIGLDYNGYDVYGNQLTSQGSFNDFFTATDENGRRTFPVSANQPIYGAAYIQDKFSYKDLILRLGVRVDYFDANTKVLDDPYSLYKIQTAEEFYTKNGGTKPASIGNDYKVYVSGEESTNVVAYRQEDQWFNTNGTATEGNLLFPGGLVFPAYKIDGQNIKSPEFNPNNTFVDYVPQVNFMPRVSFSFPISADAGFFAHYDVKVQRPPSNNVFTPLDFYFFNDDPGGLLNNPNLKPEKTVDFEVGFQQKVTNSSAIKVSAYYREMRDMIQRRFFLFVPTLTQYQSFGNIDFGTTKGFTFGYDLRRTQNIEFSASYTLQFAEGTGSSANGISTDRGNIRVPLPLSVDERHRIVSSIDYRYGKGKRYNGPSIRGVALFENTGLNVQAVAVSGQPYTRLRNASPFNGSGFTGDINGARLPWQFNIDARLDRTFVIGGKGKRQLFVNAFVRATNVLDRRNVVGAFPVTGSPTDDGYIASRFGQDRIQQITQDGKNADNFLAAHSWRLNDFDNFVAPRNIIVGIITNF